MNDLRPQIHKLSKGDMHNHLHLSAGITLLKEKHQN